MRTTSGRPSPRASALPEQVDLPLWLALEYGRRGFMQVGYPQIFHEGTQELLEHYGDVTENRAACVSAGVNVVHGHDCD